MPVEDLGDGSKRIRCDALGCDACVEGRFALGYSPDGWEQDVRRTQANAMSAVPYYCPLHAGLASA